VDTDASGCIEIAELEEAIKASNYNISPDELSSMIKELDYMGNKKINYSEFLAATVSI
jgi:Ca2+-binding EF-hand superfamily protein